MSFSLMTTCTAEFATYLMIYRKKEYKDLKDTIEEKNNKLKSMDAFSFSSSGSSSGSKQAKKKNLLEAQLKHSQQKMTFFRMKSTFLIGLFMIIVLSSLGNAFQGKTALLTPRNRGREAPLHAALFLQAPDAQRAPR